jgi:hypothetical protein
MNIFMTSDCPWHSASKLDDARVNKMLLESTQMMAIAANVHHAPDNELPINKAGLPYRTGGHRQHPCSVWVRENKSNYLWLLEHTIALWTERASRSSTKNLQSFANITRCINLAKYIPDGARTVLPNCTTHHKHISNVYMAYQLEMIYKWNNPKLNRKTKKYMFPKWNKSPAFPGW